MQETFVVSRLCRRLGAGACLLECALVGLLHWGARAGGGAITDVPDFVFVAAYGFIIVLFALYILFCVRHRLEVDRTRITSRGLFSAKQIVLGDVNEITWQPEGGGVELKTNFDRLRIPLFLCYPPDATLRIIRFLKAAFPESLQHDWDLFCLRTALPLRKPASDTRRFAVLLPRADFDRMAASCLFVELALAALPWWLAWWVGVPEWKSTVVPLAVTGFGWISLRSVVPIQCRVRDPWRALAPVIEMFVDAVVCGCTTFALVMLYIGFISLIPILLFPDAFRVLMIALLPLWLTVIVYHGVRRVIRMWRKSNALREQDLEYTGKAVREWELLDQEEAARFGESIEAHELVYDTRSAD